ncbi:MAG: O-antigen ligase domain-containing protein [Planctomycetota bacterium]|nr:MAG: O-antigen ligase domain-containing protein [Planctomycetota bacterium]
MPLKTYVTAADFPEGLVTNQEAIFSRPLTGIPQRPPVRKIRRPPSGVFRDWGIPEWFIVSQALLFAALFIPGVSVIRLLTKVAAFVSSLIALWLVWKRGGLETRIRLFKPAKWLKWIIGMLLVMIFHPDTNSLVSGTAHCILYISNYATAFWAIAALRYGMQYQRVFLILFLINATSALVGIGQFYRPNTFLPPSIMVLEKEKDSLGSLIPYYTLEDGTKILRPCGLSDTPGAASYSGAMAAIMGIIVMSSKLPLWQRLSGLALAIPGATVIYLTQVRTAILMIVVSLMALVFVMILQRRWSTVIQITAAGFIVILGGFAWAAKEGGNSIIDRYFTLIDGSPSQVLLNSSRARMVENSLTQQIWDYPMGGGLGRYGQVYAYFGDRSYGDGLWCENQVSAWMIDGGIVMLILGFGSVISALRNSLNIARFCPDPMVRHWAAGVFALNFSLFFTCFGQMPFLTNTGQQFWLMAGLTYAADRWTRDQIRNARRIP